MSVSAVMAAAAVSSISIVGVSGVATVGEQPGITSSSACYTMSTEYMCIQLELGPKLDNGRMVHRATGVVANISNQENSGRLALLTPGGQINESKVVGVVKAREWLVGEKVALGQKVCLRFIEDPSVESKTVCVTID